MPSLSTHQDSPKVPDSDCICQGTGLVTRLTETGNTGAELCECVIPVSALLSDEVVEALARRRGENETLPVGMDWEGYEAHLAKHGREDEGFRAQARADLQAVIEQAGGKDQ